MTLSSKKRLRHDTGDFALQNHKRSGTLKPLIEKPFIEMPYHKPITAYKTVFRGTFPKNNFFACYEIASTASFMKLAILQGKMSTWVSPIPMKNKTDFFREIIRLKKGEMRSFSCFENEKMLSL